MNDKEFIEQMREFVPKILAQEQKEKQTYRDMKEVMRYEIEKGRSSVRGFLRMGKNKK